MASKTVGVKTLLTLVVGVIMIMLLLATDHVTGHDPKYEEVKAKTVHAGEKATETGKEAKEGSESWAEWAKDKISEGLGIGTEKAKDTAKQTSDMAMDAAKKTKERVTETATGQYSVFSIRQPSLLENTC